ncbi:hypothetical protein E5K00_16525 [Hymenobacter aquaticus]|uniref:Right-handed parallel beta-helix repeat-containing protein n=1 Tax=Hymenobacter aquaticus TaxID=1867101 RepID=A0A4Z0PVV4_9BACT|nr:hypothetical protein [Hymenobacter aquaticus]TGE21868.1 hypothetical protein E5K00_16525 [Hymenobacter aquaticus]
MSSPDMLPKISGYEARELLRVGKPLHGYYIVGLLLLEENDTGYPVTIDHCWIDELTAISISFECPVRLLNSHFVRCQFTFVYFLQGLVIESCLFEQSLDFQAGGHNKPGFPVRLLGNTFNGFVNFFDCWYEADVQVEANTFQAGTNLLGAPATIPVTIDGIVLIQHNTGDLARNDEGSE